MDGVGYVLGHSDAEHRRLELMATWLDPLTARLLQAAGLQQAMRVLDVGTGAGDVAMLAAGLAGPTGRVVGIDIDAGVLDLARSRAAVKGLGNTIFECRPLIGEGLVEQFDLVVCRLVAVHQADRPAFLRAMAGNVAPGGVLCLLEPGYRVDEPWSEPVVPVYDGILRWQLRAFHAAGATSIGFNLVELFAEAGLPEPSIIGEMAMGGPSSTILDWMVLTLRSLMPQVERAGVASAAEVDIETLHDRARRATHAARAQLRAWPVVGAWTVVERGAAP